MVLNEWKVGCLCWLLFFLASPAHPRADDARAQMRWKSAKSLYEKYEFQRAIKVLERVVLVPPVSWNAKQKARAFLYLSICHYNLGAKKKAKSAFQSAYRLFPGIAIPGNMPVAVRQFYQRQRAVLQPKPRVSPKPRPRPRVRSKPRATAPIVRVQPRERAKPRPLRRVVMRSLAPGQPKVKRRYTGAIVFLVVGLVAAGGAAGLAIASQAFDQSKQRIIDGVEPNASAGDLNRVYNDALGTATAAAVLWGVAGAAAATSLITFCVSHFKRPARTPSKGTSEGSLGLVQF